MKRICVICIIIFLYYIVYIIEKSNSVKKRYMDRKQCKFIVYKITKLRVSE